MKTKSLVIRQVQGPKLFLGLTKLSGCCIGIGAIIPFPLFSAMDLQFLILFGAFGSVAVMGAYFMKKSRLDWHWDNLVFITPKFFRSGKCRQLIAGLPPQ